MKNTKYQLLIIPITLFFLVASCSEDVPSIEENDDTEMMEEEMEMEDPCSEEISLNDQVLPIINLNCQIAGCHLDTRSPTFDSKQAIIDNAARIAARTSAGTMPPTGPLDQDLVDQIKCWVDAGAQDN